VTPALETAHYPTVTTACVSVPEAYTCFTMLDSVEGDAELISRGVRATCEPGSLTVGQPGEAWVLRPRSEMRAAMRIVRVHCDLDEVLRDELRLRAGARSFRRGPQRVPGIERQFARLYDAAGGAEPLETEEALLTFLAALAPDGPRPPAPVRTGNGQAVRLAVELLRERFAAVVTLDELAAVARTDRFSLLRAFSRELGTTPHAYQMRVRMARARELITQGVPLSEVALAVGYSEQSALTRAFKGVVGITPGAYARTVR